mmetsp:Transcript_81097/g.161236  ORF Transcript_81097/g.161236 Transcript_81097/m.161236 type:complete len:188 (+) Transcript_81097:1812-2375(+)
MPLSCLDSHAVVASATAAAMGDQLNLATSRPGSRACHPPSGASMPRAAEAMGEGGGSETLEVEDVSHQDVGVREHGMDAHGGDGGHGQDGQEECSQEKDGKESWRARGREPAGREEEESAHHRHTRQRWAARMSPPPRQTANPPPLGFSPHRGSPFHLRQCPEPGAERRPLGPRRRGPPSPPPHGAA